MSMRDHLVSGSGEDDWLELQIQKELADINPDDPEPEDLSDPDENDPDGTEIQEDGAMEQYISWMQTQSRKLETELVECDEVLHQADIVSSRRPKQSDDYLQELAQREGVDIDTFKQKILADINRQDEEDKCHMTQVVMETDDAIVTDVPQTARTDDITMVTSEDFPAISQTAADEMGTCDINSNIKLAMATPPPVTPLVNGHGDSISGHNGTTDIHNNGLDLHSQPGGGVVAEITEADILEKQLWRQLRSLDEHHQQRQHARDKELESLRAAEQRQTDVLDNNRKHKQQQLQQQQQQLTLLQQENEERVRDESLQSQKDMDADIKLYEAEIAELAADVDKEKKAFLASQQQYLHQRALRQERAAVDIQRHYRGYRVRKQHSEVVQGKLVEVRKLNEQRRIAEVEERRKAAIEVEEKKKRREDEVERIKKKKVPTATLR